MVAFGTNFLLALQAVMTRTTALRVLLSSVLFSVNVLVTGVLWPYSKWCAFAALL